MSEVKTTFKEVQKTLMDLAQIKIEKEGRSYHYILNDSVHIYTPKMKMSELKGIINEVPKENALSFLEEKYGFEQLKEKKEKVKKTKKEVAEKEKKEKKTTKTEISKLEEQLTETTLKIMALDNKKRKTEEHYLLRDQLHEIYGKLVDLGARKKINKTA